MRKHSESGNGHKYQSELRTRQKEMTGDIIMEAVCSLIADGKMLTFNIQEVADLAGVSYGTVYNHFPSRELMIESLYDWMAAKNLETSRSKPPQTLDDLMKFKRLYTLSNKKEMEILFAVNKALSVLDLMPDGMKKRDDNARRIIENSFDLDPEFLKKVSAFIVYINTFQSWTTLTTRFDLSEEETTFVMDWAIELMIKELKRKETE